MTSSCKRKPEPLRKLVSAALWSGFAFAAVSAAQPSDEGLSSGEVLEYSLDWPSGLSAGTAEFEARFLDPGWRFEATVRASHPKAEIDDRFISQTDGQLCSRSFEKHIRHGRKRASELLRFAGGQLDRTNLERVGEERPGTTRTAECARDALTFVYFLRLELAAGRIPPAATVYFGAGYNIRLEHAQERWLAWEGQRRLVDEVHVSVRGPKAEHQFSAFFDRSEGRLPLLFGMTLDETDFTMRLLE